MHAFTTVLPFVGTVMSMVASVSGAAVPLQESTSSLHRRATHDTSTWDKYHKVNEAFVRQGLCMSYIDPTERDGTWACGQYCNNENTRVCWTPIESLQHDYLVNTNPNGERWVVGECHCDSAADNIAEILVDFTGRGLDEGFRELMKLSCIVTLNILKEAAFLGASFIPGAGQAAIAARTMVKAVKLASKTSGGKDIWTRTVEGTCSAFDDRDALSEGYDVLMAQDDPEE